MILQLLCQCKKRGKKKRKEKVLPFPSAMFETQEFFPKAYFTYSYTVRTYLPLFIGSWNMQEHFDSNTVCAVDGQF